MFESWPLLSLVIWTPIVGGMLVLATGGDKNATEARVLALVFAIITFALSIPLYTEFNNSLGSMQFIEHHEWMTLGKLRFYYHLGVDGIAMPLILLTTFMNVIIVIAGWEVIKFKAAQYMAAFLIMSGLMVGVFSALDGALFYVFWEAMLIPMFLVIGIWGGPRRVYATIKFFLYTFLGSVFMLVAFIYMANKTGSFEILELHALPLTRDEQFYIFIAFLLAFSVKIPMWPVHTWLPDAHVEAPTGGSIVLAAIMLKLGAYGFLRFSLPITPDASQELAWLMITLSLIAVVYIGFVALVQQDMKKLIAYSSIAHMGFVTLGLFIVWHIYSPETQDVKMIITGINGAVVQMISHGFISAAMFLVVGVMYERIHSRMISDCGGIANTMPTFTAFAVLFAMANAGLPGTSGFVGEFLVILAAFKANPWFAFLAASTLIIGAAYTLWMVKRVFFGEIANEKVQNLTDINSREFFLLSMLAVMVLFFGLYPAPLLEVMDESVTNLVRHILQSKIPQ